MNNLLIFGIVLSVLWMLYFAARCSYMKSLWNYERARANMLNSQRGEAVNRVLELSQENTDLESKLLFLPSGRNHVSQVEQYGETHEQLVGRLSKPPEQVFAEITPEKCALLHALLGLASEVGEIADTIKKHVIYGQPLNIHGDGGIKEESGDLLFYVKDLIQRCSLTTGEVEGFNIEKLQKRYPLGYSDKSAKERADKAE